MKLAPSERAIAAALAGNSEDRSTNGYFGSKAGAGVWQTILNNIPPHATFIEAFAGSGVVTQRKRPAGSTIVIDSDAAAAAFLTARFGDTAGVTVICGDAVAWLEKHRGGFNERTVIYCDPPYLFDTRSGGRRKRYPSEMGDPWLHAELLAVLSRITTQNVPVLLSGYRSKLYDERLAHWRRVDYRCMSRGGPREESLWCNFDAPAELHEYTVAGENFRERERLKRKKARWLAKLEKMPDIDRAVLLAAIEEFRRRRSP